MHPFIFLSFNELCEKIPGGVISIKQNKVDINTDNKLYVRERYLDNINISCGKYYWYALYRKFLYIKL